MSGLFGGGSTTTTVAIPDYLEEPIIRNITKAEELAKIGPTPVFGPTVAAMTPMQQMAGQNINAAAQAFGLGATTSPMAGMPPAQDFGGVSAYSANPIYDQMLRELEQRMPGQYAALRAPFIDPVTGAQPQAPYGIDSMPQDTTQPAGGAAAYYAPGSDFQGEGYYNVAGYPQYFTSASALRRAERQAMKD